MAIERQTTTVAANLTNKEMIYQPCGAELQLKPQRSNMLIIKVREHDNRRFSSMR